MLGWVQPDEWGAVALRAETAPVRSSTHPSVQWRLQHRFHQTRHEPTTGTKSYYSLFYGCVCIWFECLCLWSVHRRERGSFSPVSVTLVYVALALRRMKQQLSQFCSTRKDRWLLYVSLFQLFEISLISNKFKLLKFRLFMLRFMAKGSPSTFSFAFVSISDINVIIRLTLQWWFWHIIPSSSGCDVSGITICSIICVYGLIHCNQATSPHNYNIHAAF